MNHPFPYPAKEPAKVTLSIVQRGRLQQAWSNGMGGVPSAWQRRVDENFVAELLDHGRDPRGYVPASAFLLALADELLGSTTALPG